MKKPHERGRRDEPPGPAPSQDEAPERWSRSRWRRRQREREESPGADRSRETAILVGVVTPETTRAGTEESLDELARLADTYGLEVAGRVVQVRQKRSPATFIGRGKAMEIAAMAAEKSVKILLFDDDLSPGQHGNLENLTDTTVLDRCELILEIFRRNARTYEAKIQVELAQLRYLLPRLTRAWSHFSRQRGGVVVRGAGETQLEVDRRMVRSRIRSLEDKLAEISRQRDTRRSAREDRFQVALVGYTNSGKSTLMNSITRSRLLVEDRLFATLDSTVRHITPTEKPDLLITDTVGFIRKLPHGLIASFKSTLEEVRVADLLLHVVDLSDPDFKHKIQATVEVLHEIGCEDKPRILVFNKADLLRPPSKLPAIVRSIYRNSVVVSGATGLGLEELKDTLYAHFFGRWQSRELKLDYDHAQILSAIYEVAKVESVEYKPDGIEVRFRCSSGDYGKLETALTSRTRAAKR